MEECLPKAARVTLESLLLSFKLERDGKIWPMNFKLHTMHFTSDLSLVSPKILLQSFLETKYSWSQLLTLQRFVQSYAVAFWEQTGKTVKTHGNEFLIHISVTAPAAIGEAALLLEMKEHFRNVPAVAEVFGEPD